MLRRVRVTQALVLGSTVAVALTFGTGCSMDRTGLSAIDASAATGGSSVPGGSGGSGGTSGTGGVASGSDGAAPGTGGSAKPGGTSGGDGGEGSLAGAGGHAAGGAGGLQATGGTAGRAASGSGGMLGSGGLSGAGGAGDLAGASGSGGALGMGGETAAGGVGGGPSGAAGETGSGGADETGGAAGTGGDHPPDCTSFPSAVAFTPPTDGLLHCYWVHGAATDWETAESTCETENGTLATILSSQENTFVLQTLMQAKAVGPAAVAWLGASDGKASNDKTGAGTYAWVTGEPWDFQHWHANQPDGSCTCQALSSCTCDHWLAILGDGTWYSRPETLERASICEAVAR